MHEEIPEPMAVSIYVYVATCLDCMLPEAYNNYYIIGDPVWLSERICQVCNALIISYVIIISACTGYGVAVWSATLSYVCIGYILSYVLS